MSTPVIAITGAVGVGKTTIAYEVSLLLREADVSHAVIDDEFALLFPRRRSDPDGERLRLAVLRTLRRRIEQKGVPSAFEWCNQRATEQIRTWSVRPLPARQVPTSGRDPREVAADLVAQSGWLD